MKHIMALRFFRLVVLNVRPPCSYSYNRHFFCVDTMSFNPVKQPTSSTGGRPATRPRRPRDRVSSPTLPPVSSSTLPPVSSSSSTVSSTSSCSVSDAYSGFARVYTNDHDQGSLVSEDPFVVSESTSDLIRLKIAHLKYDHP